MSKINWERKVKYVRNEEHSLAGQALCEALWGLPNAHDYQTWESILTTVAVSEKSLGDYIRGIQC